MARPALRLPSAVVPPLTARQLGLFRVGFGLALIAAFLLERVLLTGPHPPGGGPGYSPLADTSWVRAVASSGPLLAVAAAATYTALACFALGVRARLAFTVAACGFLLHTLVILLSSGAHDLGLPAVTLLALTAVPWTEGARPWGPRAESDDQADARYGFAIWLPGFTLGLALLAAAVAKLTFGGLRWVTEGAVRYHFVEDGLNAPVTWGLWVASHQWASVLLSLGAVALEGLFLLHVWRPSPWWRGASGLAAVALLGGFYVFQGVVWPAWWALLVVFLPWQSWGRPPQRAARPSGLEWPQQTVVAALVAVQVFASATRTEIEPLVTWFPMYANTWASTDAFDAGRAERFERFSFHLAGTDVTERIPDTRVRDVLVVAVVAPGALTATHRERLRAVADSLSPGADAPLAVEVRRTRLAFDWEAGRYTPADRPTVVGTLDLSQY